MKDKKGSILVFAMWALVFLSILNVALYQMVSSHLEVTRRFRDRILCPYLAKAAYYYAQAERNIDETPDYDTLYELRSERMKELDSGTYIYTIVDEDSKININTAGRGILSRLPGLDEDLADEILSSELRPFQNIEELMLVEDMEEDIFLQFRDFVTVYSEKGVNINTAPREVLEALNMENDLIQIIEQYRAGEDGEAGTADDLFFESTDTIVANLQQFTGLYQGHEVALNQLISQGLIKVASEALTLEIQTEIRRRPAIAYTIVMADDKIKRWEEH